MSFHLTTREKTSFKGSPVNSSYLITGTSLRPEQQVSWQPGVKNWFWVDHSGLTLETDQKVLNLSNLKECLSTINKCKSPNPIGRKERNIENQDKEQVAKVACQERSVVGEGILRQIKNTIKL